MSHRQAVYHIFFPNASIFYIIPLQNHYQSPCTDQYTANQGFDREIFMQEHKRQYQGDDNTQLINRHDLGRLTHL